MNEQKKLTITELAKLARETTLKNGGHAPTVIAQGSASTVGTQIETLANSHDGRAQQMFTAGALLALTGQVGVLQQVFFISEGWMSLAEKGETPIQRPSADPERIEVLLISALNVPENTSELRTYEMQRNQRNNLTALKPLRNPEKSADDEFTFESPLLTAFVIGFLGLATKPDD